MIGKNISHYKILKLIAEGGMGEVYLAEQTEPVKRQVAFKIIKLGMDTKQIVGRFEAERQALAVMNHPNIAKVLDAGTTDSGRLYFVMEYVPGVSVLEYCNTHKLSTRDRLELFIQVCYGVQHAHQKGIIHRDLKPSNVLVMIQDDKPVPKVIDFGIAKAMGYHLTDKTLVTDFGEIVGTPTYMSPEQVEMSGLDVDTRTDIYSLGVMLYEILIGTLPFESHEVGLGGYVDKYLLRNTDPLTPSARFKNLGSARDSIAEERHTDPSLLQRQLKGDLDWIIMKAMEKDRTRRYETVNSLALDIKHYLKEEPVLACPPSTAYRLKKYFRRHKIGVMASALVIIAVLIGITGTTIGLIRTRKAEQLAKDEAETAHEVSEFLVGLFQVSDPGEARGNTVTAREILDKGAERINEELADQPIIQARLMNTIGIVYWRLGLYKQATSLISQALKTQRKVLGNNHLDVSESLNSLAILYYTNGDYTKAEQLFRESLSILRILQGNENLNVANCLNNLAMTLKAQGNYQESEPIYREALEIRRKKLGNESKEVAQSLNNLGKFLYEEGNYTEAEKLLRESLAINRKIFGEEHPEISANLSNLALVLRDKGNYIEAEQMFRQVLAMDRKLLGDTHPYIGSTLEYLGILLIMRGDYTKAEITLREAIEVERKTFPENHWKIAITKSLLGECLTKTGQYVTAEKLLLESYRIIKSQFSDESAYTHEALKRIIALYEAWNKPKKAGEYRAMIPDEG